MDQAILALLGVIITLMLYLDRGRRADLALHREETQRGFARMAEAMQSGDDQIREAMQNGDAQIREAMQRGFAELTAMIMDLVGRVGRLEGRAEAEAVSSQHSQ